MQGYAADNMQGQMGGDFQQRGTSRGNNMGSGRR